MNKIAIPALLLGVVMIAGAFAFMPVQEASTVHTSTATTQSQAVHSVAYILLPRPTPVIPPEIFPSFPSLTLHGF